jgi:hypothetical protein
VVAVFRQTVADQGIPASVLSDNGMVFTTRFAGGRAGRDTINGFQAELRDLGVVQKHSKPNHPTTCGKVERFHQTLKKWLTAQPQQPQTLAELQAPRETHLGLAGQLAQRLERVPLRQRRHIAQVASGCTAEQRESLIGGHLLGWSTRRTTTASLHGSVRPWATSTTTDRPSPTVTMSWVNAGSSRSTRIRER